MYGSLSKFRFSIDKTESCEMPLSKSASPISDSSKYQETWPWLLTVTPIVALLLMTLSIYYSLRFEKLGSSNDLWFGTDIARHVWWSSYPENWNRAHLHPVSFILYKSYGLILGQLGLLPDSNQLVIFAFPTILLTSLALTTAAQWLTPPHPSRMLMRITILSLFLLIGPLIIFAPMPESHVGGGIALLLQAALTLKFLRAEAEGQRVYERIMIFLFAALACGFSLSNCLPATILLLPLLPRQSQLGWWIASGVVAVVLVLCVHHFLYPLDIVAWMERQLVQELAWVSLPDLDALRESFQNLVLLQFGVPFTEFVTWRHPDTGWTITSIAHRDATFLQGVTFLLWCTGIAIWVGKSRGRAVVEKRFLLLCAGSFLALVAFHTVYSPYDAYIFSVHLWPFLLLPGVLIWIDSLHTRYSGVVACMTTAIALSVVQMILGFVILVNLSGTTDAQVGEVRAVFIDDNASSLH